MVLLAGLVAFPALGPALFLHLHHTAATHPGHSWTKLQIHYKSVHQPTPQPAGTVHGQRRQRVRAFGLDDQMVATSKVAAGHNQ
jgi:hypothetical protein